MIPDTLDEKLIDAAERLSVADVQSLLSLGADPKYKSDTGITALTTVMSKEFCHIEYAFKIAKLLVEAGADVNVRTENGDTVFVNFSALYIPTIDLFLTAGANINTHDYRGTILHVAALAMVNDYGDFTDVINHLIEKGIDDTYRNASNKTVLEEVNERIDRENAQQTLDALTKALDARRHTEIEKDHQETLQAIKSPAFKFRLKKS